MLKQSSCSYIFRLLVLMVAMAAQTLLAAVLPEDRTDLLYHSYDGGGVKIDGPSLLVRKSVSNSVSLFYNYYVDNVSSASIDVLLLASPYEEKRTEQSLGVDYLHGKTTLSLSLTNSSENDYEANTFSFNISQDFFGDLTTLSLGYAQGSDDVGMRNNPNFNEKIIRQSYRFGISQIITKNFILSAGFETITDEGDVLNNPYRSYSFLLEPDPVGNPGVFIRGYALEQYPRTRDSNAISLRANYYLPYRAAIHGEYKIFSDTWGIDAETIGIGYTQPIGDWTLDFRVRSYDQTQADFYSDLFDSQGQFNFQARDKELSTFTSTSIGVGASYEFAKSGWGFIEKGSINVSWDRFQFDYENFRDATLGGAPGTEPLYSFTADVIQVYLSLWY